MTEHQKQHIEDVIDFFKCEEAIPLGRIIALIYMADNGIYPDESFTENERKLYISFCILKKFGKYSIT